MRCFRLRLYWGDSIVIRQLDSGKYACPVCGAEMLRPAYAYAGGLDDAAAAKDKFAGGSHYVCTCCGTQFGDDDFPDHGEKATEEIWRELRERWLRTVAEKEMAAKQLKNIGIDLSDSSL